MSETTTTSSAADLGLPGLRAPGPSVRNGDVLAGVSIVLPCYNEAPNVADAVRAATGAAEAHAADFEVIVIDDGSTDGTAQIAARLADADRRVRLVVHPSNRGYGGAVRSGLRAARMPWVLLTDADLQFDLRELEAFVPLAKDADLIAGWRIARQDPPHRRLNAAAWNWLMHKRFNVPVRDIDCAFKLVRRDLLEEIPLTSSGAMISTELLVRAVAAGAIVQEVGVHHLPRAAGEQSGASPRVVIKAFRELMRVHGELRRLTQRMAMV
jgi:glycosyltransferase involved in cell wall biosynthesis